MSERLPNGNGVTEYWRTGKEFFLSVDLGDRGFYEFSLGRQAIEALAAELEVLLDERSEQDG